jgi:hypothetical protein
VAASAGLIEKKKTPRLNLKEKKKESAFFF